MRTINRAALLVRPKAPYLTWAAGIEDDAPADAKALRKRVAVYLVPEDPDEQDETGPFEWFYEDVFENELEAWTVDENLWPTNRTLEMFLEWFEVRGESLVLDLCVEEIETEEM